MFLKMEVEYLKKVTPVAVWLTNCEDHNDLIASCRLYDGERYNQHRRRLQKLQFGLAHKIDETKHPALNKCLHTLRDFTTGKFEEELKLGNHNIA